MNQPENKRNACSKQLENKMNACSHPPKKKKKKEKKEKEQRYLWRRNIQGGVWVMDACMCCVCVFCVHMFVCVLVVVGCLYEGGMLRALWNM